MACDIAAHAVSRACQRLAQSLIPQPKGEVDLSRQKPTTEIGRLII